MPCRKCAKDPVKLAEMLASGDDCQLTKQEIKGHLGVAWTVLSTCPRQTCQHDYGSHTSGAPDVKEGDLLRRFYALTNGANPDMAQLSELLSRIDEALDSFSVEGKQVTANMQANTVSSLNTDALGGIDDAMEIRGIVGSDDGKQSGDATRDSLPAAFSGRNVKRFSALPVLSEVRAQEMKGATLDIEGVQVSAVAKLVLEISQKLIVLMASSNYATEKVRTQNHQSDTTPVQFVPRAPRILESQLQDILERGLKALARPFGLTLHDGRCGPKISLCDSMLCTETRNGVRTPRRGVGLTDFFVCHKGRIRSIIELKVHFTAGASLSQMLASLLGVTAGVNNSLEVMGEDKAVGSWSSKKLECEDATHLYGLLDGFQLIAARTNGCDSFTVSNLIKQNLAESLTLLFERIANIEPFEGVQVRGSDMDADKQPHFGDVEEGKEDSEGAGEMQRRCEHGDGAGNGDAENQDEIGGENSAQEDASDAAFGVPTHYGMLIREMEANKDNFWRSLLGKDMSPLANSTPYALYSRSVNVN